MELATSIGVHASSVRSWESGKCPPTPEAGKKLAAWFGIELIDLLDIDYDTCLLPALRTRTGLSQLKACRALGWDKSLLSRIERGTRILTKDEQRTLADLYHVEVSLVAAAAQRTLAARAAQTQEEH